MLILFRFIFFLPYFKSPSHLDFIIVLKQGWGRNYWLDVVVREGNSGMDINDSPSDTCIWAETKPWFLAPCQPVLSHPAPLSLPGRRALSSRKCKSSVPVTTPTRAHTQEMLTSGRAWHTNSWHTAQGLGQMPTLNVRDRHHHTQAQHQFSLWESEM